jgi:hypothetical protein
VQSEESVPLYAQVARKVIARPVKYEPEYGVGIFLGNIDIRLSTQYHSNRRENPKSELSCIIFYNFDKDVRIKTAVRNLYTRSLREPNQMIPM